MTLPWHQNAFAILKQMIDQNHLPHELLITGVSQIGKFELMQQLVGTLINDDEIITFISPSNSISESNLVNNSLRVIWLLIRVSTVKVFGNAPGE
jgi:DNA polymerase-3 subunit delta'